VAAAQTKRDAVADALLAAMVVCYVVLLPLAALIAKGPRNSEPATYAIGFLIFLAGTRVVRIETRLTDWLGRISYSIYLFHVIIFLTIEWWLLRKQPAGSAWRTQHIGIYAAIGLAATLVVASVVYRFVEKPGIRLGHRLAERWQQRTARHAETSVSGG
jgi:peptidoglycan/LPS O-acetylase OafA/YrhL